MKGSVDFFNLVSRILAVGLFFVSGLSKITDYSANLNVMSENHVPGFFLPLVILLEVCGSVAIVFGFLTRFTSAFMAIFSILAGILFYQGYSHEHLIVWLKNASCAAGFLMLVLYGPGRYSIDYYIKKHFSRK